MKLCIRRRWAALIVMLAMAAALAGCGRIVPEEPEAISIYASFWPIYALTDAVMDGVPDAELHCLVQPQDGCLRNYALSDWDAALLARGADAVIMGGRGLENFESALFQWGEDGPAMSAVLYNLELYNQDDSAGDGESESHLRGANPHLYMSLEGAKEIVESVSATLVSLDPQYAEQYVANAEAAEARLDAALAANKVLLASCEGGRVILMNEALIYPALDYGLTVADWVDRESGAAVYDAALDDLIARLSEAEARVILIERQAPQAFVEALEGAGFAVARLDVLSTHREGEGFDAYIEAQERNARAIRAAFDGEVSK